MRGSALGVEHKIYQLDKVAWVYYLLNKYLTGPRFEAVRAAAAEAMTEREINNAREIWRLETK